jgi:hypothetical protein
VSGWELWLGAFYTLAIGNQGKREQAGKFRMQKTHSGQAVDVLGVKEPLQHGAASGHSLVGRRRRSMPLAKPAEHQENWQMSFTPDPTALLKDRLRPEEKQSK